MKETSSRGRPADPFGGRVAVDGVDGGRIEHRRTVAASRVPGMVVAYEGDEGGLAG